MTLDEYMPQKYCGEFVPVKSVSFKSSVNFYWLCDRPQEHSGKCSSQASREECK